MSILQAAGAAGYREGSMGAAALGTAALGTAALMTSSTSSCKVPDDFLLSPLCFKRES